MVVDHLFQYKMKLLILVLCIFNAEAEVIKNGVPSFLMPTESPDNKIVAGIVQNSTQKCNTDDSGSSVLCNKDSSAYSLKYESSTNSNGYNISNYGQTYDATARGPNSNQNTMQTQSLKNAMGQSRGGISLPIAPSGNVKMNINQQQLQFNIKY